MNTNNVIKLKRKRIKKINPLWIIAGLLAAILIAVLVILVRGGAEGIAETGSVTVDVDYNAVIVRNEKVITSEAFDLADYFAEEGAWVEPDTKIMQIYRRGYSEEQAAALIEDGMNVGVGGFTPSGYPKKTTMALAKAIKNGKKCRINIWSGASVGPEIEEELAAVGGVKSRMPYYAASNKSMRAGINSGQIDYIDLHLSHFAQQVDYGFFGNVDVAIVEAAAVNADGSIVLGPGVGNIPMFVKHAKKVIVEVNTTIPLSMEGMHDIYICAKPPYRTEIPIYHVGDRIGSPYLECGLDKIACIVES